MTQQSPSPPGLASWCNRLAHAALPTDYSLLDAGNLSAGHPWAFLAVIALSDPGSVAYYRYLYGLARLVDPVNILEIGTAFGMGGAAFIQGAPNLRKLISLDLGVFNRQYEIVEQAEGAGWPVMNRYQKEELVSDGRNIDFARHALEGLIKKTGSRAQLSLYRVNTQPEGSDNFDIKVAVPRWSEVKELVRELEATPIDLLFIDGKHTGDGLYQDFKSFFPYVRPGGIVLCDDLHDTSYAYAWAGQTVASFERARAEFAADIEDVYVWPFPQLPDWYGQESTARPFGLVRKRGSREGGSLPAPTAALLAHEVGNIGLEPAQLVELLRLVARHPELYAQLKAVDADTVVERVRFLANHPALVSSLLGRPGLSARLDRIQEVGLLGYLRSALGRHLGRGTS
jgi:predicted O-methyltransferase YrrM